MTINLMVIVYIIISYFLAIIIMVIAHLKYDIPVSDVDLPPVGLFLIFAPISVLLFLVFSIILLPVESFLIFGKYVALKFLKVVDGVGEKYKKEVKGKLK